MTKDPHKAPMTYADAGVDIQAGDQAVERIKKLARSTFSPQVLGGIGAFGGFFKPDFSGTDRPVFVASADGVGTKLKLAFMTGIHNTVGEDLVNHCVNDILVHGAAPLFFLDYIATGKLDPEIVAGIVEGMARGCKTNGLSLIGGETAEMPDFYAAGEYDLAGFIVGMVDHDRIIDGSAIKRGDQLVGLGSNGLHTNGYSLARRVLFKKAGLKHSHHVPELGMTVAEALMKVHRTYAPVVRPLLGDSSIHGMAHITGGGIPGNLARVLPSGCRAMVRTSAWPVPPLFTYLEKLGDIDRRDIYSAFNMGIGYILVLPPDVVDSVCARLNEMDEPSYLIGEIVSGNQGVELQ